MKIIYDKEENCIYIQFFTENEQTINFENKYWHIPDDLGVLAPSIYFGHPRNSTEPKVPLAIELSNVSKYIKLDTIVIEGIEKSGITFSNR